ncbi:MAG: phage Gp37/Gp68 family protein [Oscillospiraceae bacterium]|nr:phage Gp37/Gp68 family protein [Oscillospiraceae bacterium]
MMMWNLWHGCRKISPGCANCYVYRADARYDRDAREVRKTQAFNLPVRKNRRGDYKIPPGTTLPTCFTSDFFLDEADGWRADAWAMIRARSDVDFFIITKRIHRFFEALPDDWGGGYGNVAIYSTVENQAAADFRLPLLKAAPIQHKGVVCAPLLERLDLSAHLGDWVESVSVGGESGEDARVCDYDWVLGLRGQCLGAGVPFTFHQTGRLLRKDGRVFTVPRKFQHEQAWKAGINIS